MIVKLPNTRAGERRDHSAADPAGADHGDARRLQLALPDAADLRQHDMPRVALEFVVSFQHRVSRRDAFSAS